MAVSQVYDYLIVGAGVAGVSLAYRLKDRGTILVVERESQAGYHSSGRSAAMFMETYGTPTIRALTRASRVFFETPPAGFSEHPLLSDRGVLYIAREGQEAQLADMLKQLQDTGADVRAVSAQEVVERAPCVRPQGLIGAIEEVDAKDIDVHALLQGFLKGAKRAGALFSYGAEVFRAERDGQMWNVHLSNGSTLSAKHVINAAGAWGQQVADLFGAEHLGLQPKRRSAFTFKPEDMSGNTWTSIERWPAVVGVDESYYFKPDAGQLLGSPANADPVEPHDVVAEELDIAIGIDRITTETTLSIHRPNHTWAGLRSFLPDGDFAIGWDTRAEGFFWLVGQGGYGIQTSPGASLVAAHLLADVALDAPLQAENLDLSIVSPGRFGA